MRRPAIVLAMTASLTFGTAAFGQSTDWRALFRELVSADPAVRDAAREWSFKTLFPKIENTASASLDADVAAILETFNDEEPVRVQASAVLATWAWLRPDGTELLKRAIPVFLSQFKDQNRQVRENAVWAIVKLRPKIPSEALTHLLTVVRDDHRPAAHAAIYGVARFAETSPEAVSELASLLSAAEPIQTRRAVIQSIGQVGLESPELIAKLGEVLGGKEPELVREAIGAAANIGPAAKSLRPLLQTIADTERYRNYDLFTAAASAILRLDKKSGATAAHVDSVSHGAHATLP